MSSLRAYRRLLEVAGPLYVLVAFLGRLPLAMSQIGTLVLVSEATGSYGAGGACAGVLAVANAVAGPLWGALADRAGQRVVVLGQSLAGGVALFALVGLAQTDATWPLLAVVAGVAGIALPQVGPLARVRWRPMAADAGAAHQRRLVDTAFSYEGAADEASFVLGPAIVGGAIAVASPAAALVFAGVLLAVFGSWFALHRSAELTRRDTSATLDTAHTPVSSIIIVLAIMQLTVGTVFGSVQTGSSVLATSAGMPGLTGIMHALLGVGSVTLALAIVVLPESFGYEQRLRVFACALLVLSLPLLFVDTLGTAAITLLVLGCAVGPYMICVFTMAERITPQRRLGAVMTVLAGATGLGYAIGSSLGGRLADWGGHTPAYAVTVGAGVVATALALAAGRPLRVEQQRRRVPASATSGGSS
ncbi:MFS transporter [Solicola gregarius]|uniref:MFS transporter n=1 Tax=Solicola gregarius TaxID=2908642 RepID=A0AA46YMS1_9ACTN|nr:MFS transporter [Solicola gregarius]UYM06776.1 MFS transporter [Solicola gregarius]